VKVRNAYYWPTPVQDASLAGTYHVLECVSRGVPLHRMMVPSLWTPMSPVPQRGEEAPAVVSLVVETMAPDAASLAVLSLPPNAGFFAHEVATNVARWLGFVLGDEEPSGDVALRAALSSRREVGWLSVVHTEEMWLVLVASAPRARGNELGKALRIASATFGPRMAEPE